MRFVHLAMHDGLIRSAAAISRGRDAIPAAYSPDLNPIEMDFAKLKALLRESRPGPRRPLASHLTKLRSLQPHKSRQNYFVAIACAERNLLRLSQYLGQHEIYLLHGRNLRIQLDRFLLRLYHIVAFTLV